MALSQGVSINCNKSCTGGLKKTYLANSDDVTSLTFGPDGQVTGIVMAGLAVFYEVQFKNQTGNFQQAVATDDTGCSTGVTQTLQILLQCYDQDIRTFLLELINQSCCGLVGINEHNSGFIGIWGFVDGLHIRNGSGTLVDSGTAITDPAQVTLQLLCTTTPAGLETEFATTIPV